MVKEKMCKQTHLFATLPPQVWHRLAQPAHSKPVRLPKRKQWRSVWLAASRFVKNAPLEPCSQVLMWLWLSRGPAETQQHLPRHISPQRHRSLGWGLHPSPSPQGLCYVYWGEVNKQNNCFKWTLQWHLVHLQCCAVRICILFQDISFPSPQSPSALVHISWPPAPGGHHLHFVSMDLPHSWPCMWMKSWYTTFDVWTLPLNLMFLQVQSLRQVPVLHSLMAE